MADAILIEELTIWAKIGCTADERLRPQQLQLSLELEVDAKQAAASKSLDDTICYDSLSKTLAAKSESKEWVLVEELAEELVQTALETSPLVSSVSLLIKKFALPNAKWAGVRIKRAR